ncbi:uncharacterized protein A4U43_C03F20340 [Asparagus officinalis]|uniref:Uncharacterized protein n=1 Tax=Asparagus officinalis TaxID=4686 RepID=A0A5P1FFW0_ASPOF|nr:uncharacterized protein A4U43_C03F20340 [Asparagus officinalis]
MMELPKLEAETDSERSGTGSQLQDKHDQELRSKHDQELRTVKQENEDLKVENEALVELIRETEEIMEVIRKENDLICKENQEMELDLEKFVKIRLKRDAISCDCICCLG